MTRVRTAPFTTSDPWRPPPAGVGGRELVHEDEAGESGPAADRSRDADHVRALIESEARFRAVFDHAAVGITLLEADTGFIVASNAAFDRWLGYPVGSLVGRRAADFSPPGDGAVTRGPVAELRAGRRTEVTVEKRFVRSDGTPLWGTLTISAVRPAGSAPDAPPTLLVGMAQDITARKALERELTHRAYHDPLTGLTNRDRFRTRVADALAAAPADAERAGPAAESVPEVAVLFLDVDDFKKVNDSLGHAAGDRLLCVVAERLLHATRGCDTVARLGGDEFAVLLRDVRADADALTVAARVAAVFDRPVRLDGAEVRVRASLGVARAAPGDGPDEMLRNADLAMYRAKHRGAGGVEVFAPALHAAARERLALEADLRRALERAEFRLAFQPIVDLRSRAPVGVEALLRWTHPERGPVSPAAFIPVAERTGLIVPLGRWVLTEACRRAAAWCAGAADADGARRPFTLTVNLSGRQLQDDALPGDVAAALAASGLPPSALVLEITETVLMHDVEATTARLRALKALGVRLAVDDFGTGHASLRYLQRFPVDVLKVDKSFVDGVADAGPDAALVRTIVALGEMLSLRTIAEGIEHEAQAALLASLGCPYGQGYLFSRPLAPEAVDALLAAA